MLVMSFSSSIMAGGAQSAALSVNPRAVEFDVPQAETDIRGYRVELFHSRADTRTAQAVNALEITRTAASESRGRVRIEMRELFDNVPDGEYIVTLQTVGSNGPSNRSEPAGPFRVSGHFKAARRPPSAGTPRPPSPGSDESARNQEKEGRFWVIVGIAMGVAAFVVPFIIK
jgi:hypothetical protein